MMLKKRMIWTKVSEVIFLFRNRQMEDKKISTYKRLEKVYSKAKILPLGKGLKYVLMSDCHRGVGTWNDNFLPNQNLFFAALQEYYRCGYTYIELGDGDELWENHDLSQIIQIHSDVFWLMSQFYRECRLHMLFGNHDMKKKSRKYAGRCMKEYYCDSCDDFLELFPNIEIVEGIRLKEEKSGREIFLTHGHQGDFINDTMWRVSRFLVRHVWRRLERIGFRDTTSAAKNYKKKKKIEKKLSEWAEKKGIILIAGHTHRPAFSFPGEGMYFNDGSCVHPRCITAIEIDGDKITLVKWSVFTRVDKSLYVGREVLEGAVEFGKYFSESILQRNIVDGCEQRR